MATLLFMFLISGAFVSLGIAFASAMNDPHGFQLIMNFIIMPVFFLSGALFPLDGLPTWLHVLTRANPLTYGIDGMRFALGGPYLFSPVMNLVILVVFWILTTIVGTMIFRRMSA
jgi:ABC-2 type transport system permease protein